ncbi:MAG: hypothetical protein AAB942_00450, partial [Patescibacteria group bacterium]
MAQTKSAKKLSAKNTKQELWDAYNELLDEIKEKPIGANIKESENAVPQAIKGLSELKLELNKYLDKIGEVVLQELNSLREKKSIIARQKQQMIDELEKQKEILELEIGKTREWWNQEIARKQTENEETSRTQELRRIREEDEYQYRLTSNRRTEQDEFKSQKEKIEQGLAEQKKELDQKSKDLENYSKQIAQESEQGKKDLEKMLTDLHNREIFEIKINHKNELDISKLKLAGAEDKIKSQSQEIGMLRQQLAENSR